MFDPADEDFLADPYPEFARLRSAGEVHWHEGLGLAVAVSHRSASAVLRHRGLGRIWTDAYRGRTRCAHRGTAAR